MLREERWEESANAVNAALNGRQARIWTAIPGIIQSFNAADNTVEVQPAVQAKQRMPDGTVKDVTLPICPDVPIHFPSAGGYTLTFPAKKGDECLLVFSARSIDNWWGKGGVQSQAYSRMHDLSDGFAIIGTRSQKNALKSVSTKTVQLRNDDGKTFVEIDGGKINITAEADVTVTAKGKVTIIATGDVSITTQGAAAIHASGPTKVDGNNIVLNGGARMVARVGDTVRCPAGVGTITSGAAKVLA